MHFQPAMFVDICQRRLCIWCGWISLWQKHTFLIKKVVDRMGRIRIFRNLETGKVFSDIKNNWPWEKTKVTLVLWVVVKPICWSGIHLGLCNLLISDVFMFHFCQPMYTMYTTQNSCLVHLMFFDRVIRRFLSQKSAKNLRDLYCSYLWMLLPGASKDWRRRQG